MAEINSKIPQGPLAEKWTNYKAHQKLVNPANKLVLVWLVLLRLLLWQKWDSTY